MIKNLTSVILAIFFCDLARAEFNFTTCPASHEIMAEKVAKTFDMNKFVGTYYEQALHDYTQYPTCPRVSCIRSQKEFTDAGDGKSQIKDTFTLGCFGHAYTFPYYFNTTEVNGSLDGFILNAPVWWKVLFQLEYPDTIVDFKESEDGGQYEWVIEFQCRQKDKLFKQGQKIGFTGFNFYTRDQNPGDDVFEEMKQAATDAGLDVYFNHWPGLIRVPQDDCDYDNEKSWFRPLTN